MGRLGSIEELSVSFAPGDAFWEELLSVEKDRIKPFIARAVTHGNSCFATQAIKDGNLWGERRLSHRGYTSFETYTWKAKYGESLKWNKAKLDEE
jgi:hypothetical protein